MYLSQTDYQLPAPGGGLEITRTYNSRSRRLGMFGHGWSTQYDESLDVFGPNLLQLNLADGRSIIFTPSGTNTYAAYLPLTFHGQIVNDGTGYNLTLKDGSVLRFSLTGKLLSQTDRNGNQTSLTYGSNGEPATITDPVGRTINLAYNSDGQVTTITDAMGLVTTYTYDWTWAWSNWVLRLRTVTYGDGSQFKFTYEYPNKLITVKDALDNILEAHTYDSQDRALTSEVVGDGTERYTLSYISAIETDVTDALNHVTKYFFDTSKGRNVVTRVEGSCGCGNSLIQNWTYDNQLNMTSITDGLNHSTTYTYDANGNRLTETNAAGTNSYTYNSAGDLLTRTDPMNGVWTNTYNSQGNQLTAKDPLNNTTSFTYNSQGQLLTATDPRNNTITFTYDSYGNLTRRTDALSNQTNLTYDTRGRVIGVTNSLSRTTSYEYDAAGRLKKIIYPDTNFALVTYDLAGRRTKIKDPRGNETNFAYDSAYRLTSETNADGKVTSYAYDVMSKRTGVTDALNRTTDYFYDDFSRLTKIKYPEATAGAGRLEVNFAYDLAGNLTQKTDQAGKATAFAYDNANRLTSVIDPALEVTTYEYNARSQRTAVVDASNQRYEFVYDAFGRRLQEKKGAATISFAYDAAGNRTQRTDYNGAVTTYAYDALNRLTSVSYPDTSSASYGYDAVSRLTTATNPSGTVTIAYDNRDRVSSVTDVFGQVVGYGYDANSNRTQLSLGGVTNANYQYDVINRLTQLTDAASLNTTFAYDSTNKLTSRTLPNGVVTTSQYDGLNRLTRLTHAKGGNTLADFQYQLNAGSNITQIVDGAGAHNYTYDNRDRLTAATHPSQSSESYTLDDVGNRTASHQGSSYTYQSFNRLVTANSTNYTYNANGNLISKSNTGGSWSYTWDYENRLKQAAKSGGATVTYVYDALGRRVKSTSSVGGVTKFVYDGVDVVRDLDANGNIVTEYLNAAGIDRKLRQTTGGVASYFVADHLGTTRGFTDSSGNTNSSLSYDSFGNLTSGSATSRYTYTGRESDSDTGLLYYRARWYDPEAGRFISEDPIGFEGGVNFYAYVDNRPLRYTDPFGRQKISSNSGDLPLDEMCDTDDCELLLQDILAIEISLHIRDYVERWEFGGTLDKGHLDRIDLEDAKLKECLAKYFAKCTGCPPPTIIPLRKPNVETNEEFRLRQKSIRHQNIAIGAAAAGAFAGAGVVVAGGAAGAAGGVRALLPLLAP